MEEHTSAGKQRIVPQNPFITSEARTNLFPVLLICLTYQAIRMNGSATNKAAITINPNAVSASENELAVVVEYPPPSVFG